MLGLLRSSAATTLGLSFGAGAPLGLFDNVCGAKDAGQGSVLGDSEFGFPSLTVGCRDQFRGSGLSRLVVLGPRCCATAGGSFAFLELHAPLLFLSLLPSRRLCPDSTVAVTGRWFRVVVSSICFAHGSCS